MSKSGKFAIFWNFLSHDVAGFIYWLFVTICGSVYVIYRVEDAFVRLGGFAGVGISALIALLMFLGLKDDWKTLKNDEKTLKNDEEILENGWKTLKGNGDNDDIYKEDDAYEEDDIYEDDDAYEEDDIYEEDDDDIYDDDAYDDDTYDDEEYDEELEQKTIKERAWEIFGNVLLKIPDEGVWGSIVNTIVGLIICTLIGACIVIVVQVLLYIVSTLIRACL